MIGMILYYLVVLMFAALLIHYFTRIVISVYAEWKQSLLKEDFLDMLISALVKGS